MDAGAIGAGHAVTALYAVRLAEDGPGSDPFATIQLRWTDPDSGASQRLSRDIRASDLAGSFDGTDPHFRLDAIVAASAEVLRGQPVRGPPPDRATSSTWPTTPRTCRGPTRSTAFLHLLDAMRRIVD